MASSDRERAAAFDVVVVPFPYADRLAEKRRPALVISSARLAPYGLVWVAMITSAENEPRPSDVSLDGRIIAAFSPAQFLAAERFVVLNRGRRDGVQTGNRSFVIRRGDGYRRLLEQWEKMDTNWPKEVVGELWVIDVRDNASVAWIARSSKELRVGEVVEMRKGY